MSDVKIDPEKVLGWSPENVNILGQKKKKVTKRILGKQINKGLDKIKNKKSIPA